MHFKGVFVGKMVNTVEDLISHSYSQNTDLVVAEPVVAVVTEPVVAVVAEPVASDPVVIVEESEPDPVVDSEPTDTRPKKSRR